MRKVLFLLAVIAAFFVAVPAQAQDYYEYEGVFSLGLGYGFGDDVEPGPYMLSGKYWSPMWELGTEVYWSGDEDDEFDQIGMAWLAYRLYFDDEEMWYGGLGPAFAFESWNGFENEFGGTAFLGYDDYEWGAQLKYTYFDPSIISLVVYYHFNEEY